MKTPFTPNPGDRVFLEDGIEAVFVATQGGEHIVRTVQVVEYGDGEPEEIIGRPRTAEAIYPSEPIPKYAARVEELQVEIAGLEAVRDNLDIEIEDRKRAEQARLAKLKSHQALQRIEDYLDGKITHIVTQQAYSDRVEIVDVNSPAMHAGDDGNRYESVKKRKLMTLCGDEKGLLKWGLNHYSSGGGNDSHFAWPFCSYEEAQKHAATLLDDLYAKARKDKHTYGRAIECAEACGLTPPDDILNAFRESQMKAAEALISAAEKALSEARTKHAALYNPA